MQDDKGVALTPCGLSWTGCVLRTHRSSLNSDVKRPTFSTFVQQSEELGIFALRILVSSLRTPMPSPCLPLVALMHMLGIQCTSVNGGTHVSSSRHVLFIVLTG